MSKNRFFLVVFIAFSFFGRAQSVLEKTIIGNYTITPIHIAIIQTKTKKGTISEPVNIFLIQGNKLNILVDAGIDTTWNSYKDNHLSTKLFFNRYSISKSVDINWILNTLKLSTDSINYIIFTHLHFDHFYNAYRYKNATFITSKKERKAFRLGLLNGYLKTNKKTVKKSHLASFTPDDSLKESYEYSQEVFPGIKLLPCYGHTKGHLNILITEGKKGILFTGDCKVDKGFSRNLMIMRFLQKNDATSCYSNH